MKQVVGQARPKRVGNLAAAALTGVLAALTVLGVGHLVAAFIDPAASPFYAMGAAVVDHTPHALKDEAIRRFGSNDKLALFVSMGAVMIVFAAILGIVERRRPLGSVLLVLLGGVVVVAALQRPTATTWFAVPAIVGVIAGVVVMRVLIRQIPDGGHRLSAESAATVTSGGAPSNAATRAGDQSTAPHSNAGVRGDSEVGGAPVPSTGRHAAQSNGNRGAGPHSPADGEQELNTRRHSSPVDGDHAVRRSPDSGGTRWWRTRLNRYAPTDDPQVRDSESNDQSRPEGGRQSASSAGSAAFGSAEARARQVASGDAETGDGHAKGSVAGASSDAEAGDGRGVDGFAGPSGDAEAGAGRGVGSGAGVSADAEVADGRVGGNVPRVNGDAGAGDGRAERSVAGASGEVETGAGRGVGSVAGASSDAEAGAARGVGSVAGVSGDAEAGAGRGAGGVAGVSGDAKGGAGRAANGDAAANDKSVGDHNAMEGARSRSAADEHALGTGRHSAPVGGDRAVRRNSDPGGPRDPGSGGGKRSPGEGASRRRFLAMAAGVGALAAGAAVAGKWIGARLHDVVADRAGFVVPRAAVPAPAAGPGVRPSVSGLSEFVTPNDRFYRVDTALQLPALTSGDWRLRIHGMVDRPIELDFDQLRRRTPVERLITMTCVSNEVGGDLAGTAVWTGYPLADLLAEVGVRPESDMLLSRSVDGFTASTPVSAVTDGRDALLAIGMNGEPLPIAHGYPARLIVPGLYGYVSATKWVIDLELTRFDRAKAYWTDRGWGAQAPIKTASRIDVPAAFATIPAGEVIVAGVAWAQHRGVDAVEVQVDNQPWQPATLADEYSTDTWRQWTWRWTATPGPHTLRVRATDRTGAPQTDTRTPPFPDGSTGWHSRVITVN